MDFGAMMGGDWGGGFAQGMQMAMNEKRLAMQEREAKQQAQRMKMLMEEHMLKMKEQRELREGQNKIKQMFSPQMGTKTEMNDPADPSFGMGTPIERSVTTTQESPLMGLMKQMYGTNQAGMIGSLMQADPKMGMKLMTDLKPQEAGYKVVGDRLIKISPNEYPTEVIGSNKAPTTRVVNKGGLEVTQQWDAGSQSWKEIGSGPKWNPNAQGREGPEETGAKVKARLMAKVQAFRELMGRDPTQQEKRAMMINDPYGILGGEEGEGANTPAPTAKILDKVTAGQILKEAGGDKNKARSIAKQRGYKF